MKKIPLRARNGSVRAWALVDDADFELVGLLRWCLPGNGYPSRTINGHMQGLHRVLMGIEYGDCREVDHINGDPLDNRRCNLRVLSRAQNAQNLRAHPGISRYRGVSKMKKGWRALAKLNGHTHWIGYFKTEIEAARAVAAWRAEHMPHANPARDLCFDDKRQEVVA